MALEQNLQMRPENAKASLGIANRLLKRLMETMRPTENVRARDVAREVPGAIRKVSEGIGGFAKGVGQSLVREGSAAMGGILAQPVGTQATPQERFKTLTETEVVPSGGLSEALTGKKKAFSLSSEGEETLQGFGTSEETAQRLGPGLGVAMAATDFIPGGGGAKKVVQKGVKEAGEAGVFKGFKDLSTKIVEKLRGKSVTSKQEILDFTNMGDVKQGERDIIRRVLEGFDEKVKVPVQKFANKVKTELLPLRRDVNPSRQYENITLSDELRGPVADYNEHVYQSPIKTSAKDIHFSDLDQSFDGYFAHTRIEDLAPPDARFITTGGYAQTGKTRRVIELQSDLFQKGGLEQEKSFIPEGVISSGSVRKPNIDSILGDKIKYQGKEYTINSSGDTPETIFIRPRGRDVMNVEIKVDDLLPENPQLQKFISRENVRKSKLSKLEPYRNTWHERIIREEVKQAAKDGKTKLQFPTGETAMKIEGLGTGEGNLFSRLDGQGEEIIPLNLENIEVGTEIRRGSFSETDRDFFSEHKALWVGDENALIITDVLGDGKFKAVPKGFKEKISDPNQVMSPTSPYRQVKDMPKDYFDKWLKDQLEARTETFDISGKVDTNNPIYRFYEKEVGKYLKNKYNAQLVTDPQGVKWWEINVGKEQKRLPVEAFAGAPLLKQEDDN